MESEYPTPGMLFIPKTDDFLELWVVISTHVHVVDGIQRYTICWLGARQELFVGLPQTIDRVSMTFWKAHYEIYDHAGNAVDQ